MKTAKIFGENNNLLVNATDIKNGLISREHEFVDPEYEFKVIYVGKAKNNGTPYFRLYLSYDDYIKMSPERKSKYDYLRKMKHYDESFWHRSWEERLAEFAKIEAPIKDENTGKYKRADAYYETKNVVIEFQHSYISGDFIERSEFYSKLGLKTIWLFDLTSLNVSDNNNVIELLEDNSKGFFRVCEECKNIKNYQVYIQVSNQLIYRVTSLERKEVEGDLQSSIRYFTKNEVYTAEEFVDMIKTYPTQQEGNVMTKPYKSLFEIYKEENMSGECKLIVMDMLFGEVIQVFKDIRTGRLSENYSDGCIAFNYCHPNKNGKLKAIPLIYSLQKKYAYERKWELIEVIR